MQRAGSISSSSTSIFRRRWSDDLPRAASRYATRAIPILADGARVGARPITGLSPADDYLVKPFSMRELVARVAAVRRRVGGGGGG